jgi:hypothetical protein
VPSAPRIDPLDEDAEGLLSLNIFRTMAKHRPLAERFSRFGGYLLFKGLVPAREREIVIRVSDGDPTRSTSSANIRSWVRARG